jgi:fructokinase
LSLPSTATLGKLADRITALEPKGRRLLIAIAGPPASGKSTLAEALVSHLNREFEHTALVPMDGFHLDNRILTSRDLLHRKGAPETFDAAGFLHMVRRLGTEEEVVIPVFDRSRDIAIAGAASVGPEIRTAIVEGNYLLLGDAPWNALFSSWDFSIFLDVPEAEIINRSVQRWLDHGLRPDDADARARSNDLPNAQRVKNRSVPASLTL